MDYSLLADYDKHHRRQEEEDFAAWFDSLPAAKPAPTCGQCKHFEVRESSLDAPNIGVCKLRKRQESTSATTWITTLEPREPFDPICDRYEQSCPF